MDTQMFTIFILCFKSFIMKSELRSVVQEPDSDPPATLL